MTEFHIDQSVRFRKTFRGYGNAILPITEELPDDLAEAVIGDEPMSVKVKGYEHHEEEDTDVVIVSVQWGKRRCEQWVHWNAVEPV